MRGEGTMRSEEEREVPQQKQKNPQHTCGEKRYDECSMGGRNHVSHFSWHAQYLVRSKGNSLFRAM